MQLIAKLYEKDIGLLAEQKVKKFSIRRAARAVVFNSDNKIAFILVSKYDYHKIPGGGIKEHERVKQALTREVLEEVGCDITILKKIGKIIEYKNTDKEKQISYCFFVKVKGKINAPSFTLKEKSQGFELFWVDIDTAIKLLQNDNPKTYIGKFIQKRDLTFLQKAKQIAPFL